MKRLRAIAVFGLPALVLLAVGCKPFSGPLPGNPSPEPYFIEHLQGQGSLPLSLDLGGETRDVYFTFVNPGEDSAFGSVTVSGAVASEVPGAAASLRRAAPMVASVARRAPTPAAITEFNQTAVRSKGWSEPSLRLLEKSAAPSFDTVGSNVGGTFYDIDETPVPATCWAVVPDVAIAGGGTRTLNIWVADDCWFETGSKPTLITQEMVNALADQYLKAGGTTFDDIYDWVTDMLGAEWGPTGSAMYIPANDEITILLCDIAGDNSTDGGVVGFFWSKDNFTTAYEPSSSTRVMFTIDAVMYANGDDPVDPLDNPLTWVPTEYWPEVIFSTLAHEFQHMIQFYQRGVLRNAMAAGDTWINEMASQVVEDLLADKMDVIGPRGITGTDGTAGAPNNTQGRLPLFNYWNDISLNDWGGSGDLESYSVAYAFGAWLARNYGGAMLLNRLMNCSLTGPSSIEYIVSQATGRAEYFPRLMQRWSTAQLLSNVNDAPPGYRYNIGTFFDSAVGAAVYQLGSIDLYNYDYDSNGPAPGGVFTGPWIYNTSPVGMTPHLSTSAALYRARIGATGPLEWTLDMPGGLIASVIAR